MKLRLAVVAIAIAITYVMLPPPQTATAENVPSATAVEWEGKKPCEPLYEDEYVRMARVGLPVMPE